MTNDELIEYVVRERNAAYDLGRNTESDRWATYWEGYEDAMRYILYKINQ